MNLELIYDEMNLNILKHFIFYIPTNEITKKLYDSESLSKMDKKVFYLNGNFNIIEFLDANPLEFLNKPKLLESNYFKILELKNEINNDGFVLFYKTYLKQINAFTEIANLVNENIKKDIPNCSEEVLGYVKYNFFILNEHQNSIKEIEPSLIQISTQKEKLDLSVLDKLPKQIKNSFIPKTSINETLLFRDFIIHEKKIEIEQIIKIHCSNLRGVSLRYLIEFLKEERLLMLNYGDATKLHSTLKKLFDGKNIGAYTTIFDQKIFDSTDIKYKNAKLTFAKILQNFL